MQKKRILSGMRPTGKLHIGHYVGALENWVNLQENYENYHLIADYHVLTTSLDTKDIEANSIEMLIDWLAAGLDPNKSPMFRQSQIKEHAELHLLFSMLVTVNRLERNPTLKDQVRDLNIENVIYGHLGYPFYKLQTFFYTKEMLCLLVKIKFLISKFQEKLQEDLIINMVLYFLNLNHY